MLPDHPLDRNVWNALAGPLRHRSMGDGRARRFAPEFGLFAAAADDSAESQAALARLCRPNEVIVLVELTENTAPPGLSIIHRDVCWQMVAERLTTKAGDIAFDILDDADAPQMQALAAITKPGPFFERSHQLGRFIGVRVDGCLVAMAGERMRLDGFTEVSAVCTHPDFRGQGYAAQLTRAVSAQIIADGQTPFLQVFEANAAAIAIYKSLGFALRRKFKVTALTRP